MPKEIYKENIKKLDKEIKDTDRKIIKLEKKYKDLEKENNRLTRKSAPNKFKFNNKTDSDNYGKISKKMLNIALLEEELREEKLRLKNKKTKNENLLFIENLRPKTGIGSRQKKYDKLLKAEAKGLI